MPRAEPMAIMAICPCVSERDRELPADAAGDAEEEGAEFTPGILRARRPRLQ
ncbi:hypothetical protein GCM10009793_21420 [Brachybacterium phenoliresistens]